MQLFYNPDIDQHTPEFIFPTEESKHIVKVLRKKEGDILHITNGKGYLFEAKILRADIRKCAAKIIKETFYKKEKPDLHLVVAPTKMNDRYEWFLEKVTELGVTEITPIICNNSERKVIKLDRMEKVLQAAMKQSLQFHLPKINEPISFKNYINTKSDDQLFIAHCEETNKVELKLKLEPHKNVTILIGPEGDFSTQEINLALENGYVPVALGSNRLRTETAAIYAATCFSILNP
jgi:16S rRNA (uracil1498-N3)-methyltransferase